MQDLDQIHPQYGFAKNNGYPTKAYLDAIQQFGVLKEHRRSYKPVRLIIEQSTAV